MGDADSLREELAQVKEKLLACSQILAAREQAMADAAHELRTPLSTMVTWLEILQEEEAAESTLREGLKVIRHCLDAQVRILIEIAANIRRP